MFLIFGFLPPYLLLPSQILTLNFFQDFEFNFWKNYAMKEVVSSRVFWGLGGKRSGLCVTAFSFFSHGGFLGGSGKGLRGRVLGTIVTNSNRRSGWRLAVNVEKY